MRLLGRIGDTVAKRCTRKKRALKRVSGRKVLKERPVVVGSRKEDDLLRMPKADNFRFSCLPALLSKSNGSSSLIAVAKKSDL
jgi:hypothetical protein